MKSATALSPLARVASLSIAKTTVKPRRSLVALECGLSFLAGVVLTLALAGAFL